jgi:hypothetical protein
MEEVCHNQLCMPLHMPLQLTRVTFDPAPANSECSPVLSPPGLLQPLEFRMVVPSSLLCPHRAVLLPRIRRGKGQLHNKVLWWRNCTKIGLIFRAGLLRPRRLATRAGKEAA